MNKFIYDISPPSVKNLLASIYGKKLYSRRYKNDYFISELPNIIQRNAYEKDQIIEFQNNECRKIIQIAGTRIPYYKQLFNSLGVNFKDICTCQDISKYLPVLEKDQLRKNPESFVDETVAKKTLNRLYTSGTTGTPICIYRDRRSDGTAYAYYEARWRLPHGINKDSAWAMLGGKLVVPQNQKKPPFWVWNSGLKQLYMSSYHLNEAFGRFYIEELLKRGLDYIHGYASSLYSLALFAEKIKCADLAFKVAISNAEPLYIHQREKISEVFNCDVVDTYGSTEWCFQGFECGRKRLHSSFDVGYLELVDSNDQPVGLGEIGEVVCTGFINHVQPLIRYRTGDIAKFSKAKCDCGCHFPVFETIEGRIDDLVVLKDGKRIGRLDPVFKNDLPIIEAQIIQKDYEFFTIKLVPDKRWGKNSENILIKSFKEFVGDVNVKIDIVNNIERTKSGKFKAVLSEINK